MVELVDTLRLERSAVRCAGSSPVPGILYCISDLYKILQLFRIGNSLTGRASDSESEG